MDKTSGLREAILWSVAAALFLAAAVLTYTGEGQIKWPLLAAAFFMAAVAFRAARRSRLVPPPSSSDKA